MFFRKVQGGGGGFVIIFFTMMLRQYFLQLLISIHIITQNIWEWKHIFFFGGKEKDSITNI